MIIWLSIHGDEPRIGIPKKKNKQSIGSIKFRPLRFLRSKSMLPA
jgi:hypothetical protein